MKTLDLMLIFVKTQYGLFQVKTSLYYNLESTSFPSAFSFRQSE